MEREGKQNKETACAKAWRQQNILISGGKQSIHYSWVVERHKEMRENGEVIRIRIIPG